MPRTVRAKTHWSVVDGSGYNRCTLSVDGEKVASCDGGGYDMTGTCWGEWLQNTYPERIRELIREPIYGLKFYNPNIAGNWIDLPTERHTRVSLDGGCGIDCMFHVLRAIGGEVVRRPTRGDDESWDLTLPE